MIFRVNFGFHGRSFGAPAPVFKWLWDGFGPLYNAAGLAKQARNKPGAFPAAIFPDLPAVTTKPIWGG
jgi:hypothetical protein